MSSLGTPWGRAPIYDDRRARQKLEMIVSLAISAKPTPVLTLKYVINVIADAIVTLSRKMGKLLQ
jgi:hypothetical protein